LRRRLLIDLSPEAVLEYLRESGKRTESGVARVGCGGDEGVVKDASAHVDSYLYALGFLACRKAWLM
jgi:hypothetical protein